MVLLALIFGFAVAGVSDSTPCWSLVHRMEAGPIPETEVSHYIPSQRIMEKQARTPLGGLSQSFRSANFFIQWGIYDGFSNEDIERLATALEDSWAIQIDRDKYPLPRGADTYLVNVYIGNTHERAPQIFSNARAYVDTDEEGYTRIVVSPKLLAQEEDLKTTAAHELFHTIQWHANADYIYAPGSPSNWYWEATAVWMEQEVFPDATALLRHLPSFLFYPELPLNYFPTTSTGALSDTHAYGAFLFPLFLDQQFPESDILRTSFTNTQGQNNPLHVLQRLLIQQNTSLKHMFFHFSEVNGTLNYPERNAYLSALDAYGGFNTANSNRPSGTLSHHSDAWKSNEDQFPPSMGANYWRVVPSTNPFTVRVESFEDGDWYAALVTFDGVDHTATSVQWTGKDQVSVQTESPVLDSWLVIAVFDSNSESRLHPYRVSFHDRPQGTDTGHTGDITPPKGHCNATGTYTLGPVVFSVLLFRLRRRRQKSLHLSH